MGNFLKFDFVYFSSTSKVQDKEMDFKPYWEMGS
jgi:hypothetical protein